MEKAQKLIDASDRFIAHQPGFVPNEIVRSGGIARRHLCGIESGRVNFLLQSVECVGRSFCKIRYWRRNGKIESAVPGRIAVTLRGDRIASHWLNKFPGVSAGYVTGRTMLLALPAMKLET